jgi:hypothetical protein
MASAASLLRMLDLLVAAVKAWAVQDGTYIHLACLPYQPACLVSRPALSARYQGSCFVEMYFANIYA